SFSFLDGIQRRGLKCKSFLATAHQHTYKNSTAHQHSYKNKMPKRRWKPGYSPTSSWRAQTCPPDLPQKEVEDVQNLFKKVFKFSAVSVKVTGNVADSSDMLESWIGGDPEVLEDIPNDSELQAQKKELNKIKDKLSSKDIEDWHTHTTKCNIAASVIPHVKNLGVEMCTQAWVKFYEILNKHPIVPRGNFLSLHLCEAPGAFVTSLNHFLQQRDHVVSWDWRATTLNPYFESNSMEEMIADDRLIRHTYSQWFFGKNGSGDITHDSYVHDLFRYIDRVKKDQELELLLVTADGSKDCQINPAEQEALVSRLHYCEMIAACLTLAKHGCFVLKVFTLFEPASVALVFLLNVLFSEVIASKPSTSKSGNSEIYLVCRDYKKNVKEETLWKLLDLTVYSEKAGTISFKQELPVTFLQEHRECCQRFSQWQIATIENNIQLYEGAGPDAYHQLHVKQDYALNLFLQKTKLYQSRYVKRIAKINRDDSAFYIPNLSGRQLHAHSNWQHKVLKGTFDLRQNTNSKSWLERVELMEVRDISSPDLTLQCQHPLEQYEVIEWTDIEKGSPFSLILNSRLCDVTLMNDLNMLLKNPEFNKCRQDEFVQHAECIGKMVSDIVLNFMTPGARGAPSCQKQIIFWDEDVADETSLVYKSVMSNIKNRVFLSRVKSAEELESVARSQKSCFTVFCNVSLLCDDNSRGEPESYFEELRARRKMVQRIAAVLRHLHQGCQLILLTSTVLTRLSAGLLYILARSFNTTYISSQANLWLHQVVVFDNCLGGCPVLEKHLTEVEELMGAESSQEPASDYVMEVVPFSSLL
ncbi:unnamed protein product, partial [Lymnaea stagnalis]